MRRYFYDSSAIISKWLERNAFAKSYEDSLYRTALLSALHNNPDCNLKNLREQILNMTMDQQQKYSNNSHIEFIFNHFHLLHKYSRGRSMIVDANTANNTTALVDPDKFPIWDLKKYSPIYRSLWGNYLAQLRYDLGFQPIIRESQVQHIASGRGVFAIIPMKNQKITVGSFLGLVPGKVYANFNDFKNLILKQRKQYHRQPQHIHFPSGKILQLGDLSIQRRLPYGLSEDSASKVDATYHNPYAFGHMINHPPPGYEPNVIFSEMSLDINYLPRYLLKYLPYQDYTNNKQKISLFGIIAIKQIEHKQQLFVNYNESHIYPIDNVPEWLIQPSKYSPIFDYLKKGQYQYAQSAYWKIIEKKALSKNKQLLKKYEDMQILRPGQVQFQDQTRRYRKLKIKMEQDNQYDHM